MGLGGLIGAVVVRQQAIADLDEQCPSHSNCPDSVTEVVERGETASLLVNVFAAVGGLGLATSAALLIADMAGASDVSDDDVAVRWSVSPVGGYLGIQSRF